MNLGKFYQEHFENDDIDFDLDAIYKRNATHTHERALEEILLIGISYAVHFAVNGTGNKELREDFNKLSHEHTELCKRHEELKLKYDGLNAKFNINQPTVASDQADAERAKLVTQAMGMGTVFQTREGYEQRS